jgi:acetyltransferase-like isoleucine patch superfamily enzyme
MSEDSTKTVKENPEDDFKPESVVKEEVKLQYHIYITIFLIIYYSSYLIPGIVFFAYVLLVFLPNFLETANFIALFIEIKPLLSLLFMPLVIIVCYLLHLLIICLVTAILWRITEKISPSKDGIIPRNIRSKVANYYHIRSAMIKYGKNAFTKGIFPWLANWLYNTVGSSKIRKGSTIEESVGSEKFVDMGENSYVGVNSTLASHILQGIFGNIFYFKIKVGNNVTTAAMNQIGPGAEIHDDAYLLPLASANKLAVIKGDNNYYFGIPLRKIFKRKIMNYLGLNIGDLKKNENVNEYLERKKREKSEKKKRKIEVDAEATENATDIQAEIDEEIDISNLTEEDLAIDFTTSSAISRVNIKFLAVYLPILWLAGLMVCIYWYEYVTESVKLSTLIFMPISLLFMFYIFFLGCLIFSKLLLILINLIHKPKEGIFLAQIGDTDYEFWMLRTELKKIVLWLARNSPLPWIDALAFKWFGLNMDFSSHLTDAWCDGEFINFGRKVLVGQGATIMSSMVIGKYLIIKKVFFDDYVMVGGHTTIAPGTIIGKESVIGALCTSTYDQILEPGWIYFGIPAIKLKENKYAEEHRDVLIKRHVDDKKTYEIKHDVNIDEDKKVFIKTLEEEEEEE